MQSKGGAHPLSLPSGRRVLLHGQGLLDVKGEHGLKKDRAVLSEERPKFGIIQDPHRIIANENAVLCNHAAYVHSAYMGP
jgi:hypothetical protein